MCKPRPPYEPPMAVIEAVESVLDEAIARQTNRVGDELETFIECKACGEWDSHTSTCIIPALIRWMGYDVPHADGRYTYGRP